MSWESLCIDDKLTDEWIQDSTFLDYIRGGLRINLCVAVDLSGGGATDPTSQDSLHFLNPRTQENVYTTAIRTVGDILQDYDYGMAERKLDLDVQQNVYR